MKQMYFFRFAALVAVFLSTVFLFTSCQKEISPGSAPDQSLALSKSTDLSAQSDNNSVNSGGPVMFDLMHFPDHLEDANGNMPVGDATPLFNKNGGHHVPIMTPDGSHQVTLGEFNMISGTASVKCINAGTHVVMHLTGLIPNGVYTIWTVVFKSPGFDGTFANRIGFGALGAIEGSANSNSFTANDEGNASISVIRPGGELITDGSVVPPNTAGYVIPNCLGDVYEVHLALAYHLDNIAHAPGAPPTWAVQGFFQIWGSQL